MTRMTRSDHSLDAVAEDWQLDAACRGFDPTLWELDHRGRRDTDAYRLAHHICDWCPVTAPCLELGAGAEGMIYGGVDFGVRHVHRPPQPARIGYCEYCHGQYEARSPQQRFCTNACRLANMRVAKQRLRAA